MAAAKVRVQRILIRNEYRYYSFAQKFVGTKVTTLLTWSVSERASELLLLLLLLLLGEVKQRQQQQQQQQNEKVCPKKRSDKK